jgi:release factor glutamine methyltransferase
VTSSRTAGALIDEGAASLESFTNGRPDAELLFRGISGWSRADVVARDTEELPATLADAFQAAVARRLRHEPVQYILGFTDFWRDCFVVTPDVLIPRPDTEILVEAAAARLAGHPSARILDLGTGSGCIALSLLRELPGAQATCVDVSAGALTVAEENARRLGLKGRATFLQSRWYEGIDDTPAFDAIVSNPPYVSHEDRPSLAAEVRDFEPGLALFSEPADDLSSYRAILDGIGVRLVEGGLVAFEVGHDQAARVAKLMSSAGLRSIETRKDLAGIDRVVLGRR